jgi:hypothetical protein
VYIRTKLAKRYIVYQIVEDRREGGTVRQHVLCSLGAHRDPRAVRTFKAQHKKSLAGLDRIYPAGEPAPVWVSLEREQRRRWIEALARDIAVIDRFLEQATVVGTTKTE